MLNLSKTVTYIETNTLTGKKLVVGDKDEDSYIVIKDRSMFFSLLNIFNNMSVNDIKELPNEYQPLATSLKKRGFLNDSTQVRPSFNELSSFSNTLFSKRISSGIVHERNNAIISFVYFTTLILMLVLLGKMYIDSDLIIDIDGFKVYEIVLSLTLLPFIVLLIHEAGHFIASKIAGIAVKELRVGLYVIYPTVYLKYKGVNICKTHNRLIIISGGVFAHTLGALIGFIIYYKYGGSNLIVLWIISNISMIFANVLPLGATDGYFFLSSLLGVYNLRFKGYQTLNNWMHLKFRTKKNSWYGFLLIFLWTISFKGLFDFLHTIGQALNIQNSITNIVIIIVMGILLFRFFINIYKLK